MRWRRCCRDRPPASRPSDLILAKVSWSIIAPAGSVALPAPPSAPSVSPASAAMPVVSLRSPARRQRVFLVGAAAAVAAHRDGEFAARHDRHTLALRAARATPVGRDRPPTLRTSPSRSAPRIDDLVAGVARQPDRRRRAKLLVARSTQIARARMQRRQACQLSFFASLSASRIASSTLKPYFATSARASASVVGSGTVGPEAMADGSSCGTSDIAQRRDLGQLPGTREPAALDPRQVLANGIDLADRRARAQQRAGQLPFLRERHAFGGRGPVGRTAARQQHQQEIVGAGALCQPQTVLRAFIPASSGTGWPAFDHPDPRVGTPWPWRVVAMPNSRAGSRPSWSR